MTTFKTLAILAIGVLFAQLTYAQNNVVVIPMAGDDVAMAQQNFRYTDRVNNGAANEAFMCQSDIFATPNQETQVLLIANANARFTADSSYWFIDIEVSEDAGSFFRIGSSEAFNEARSGSWSQISTTDILDLDPNSTYQFRVRLDASESDGTFSGSDQEYCELVVSATYKLPSGKNILEVVVD